MTARSIGSATIAFGLVSIPVKLYSTAESGNDISFHMHHDADGARLKQQYVCTKCGEVVDREHTVKGYEHGEGQHVLLSAEELKALEALATHVIAIEEFVPVGEVRPLWVEKSYYLSPDKGSERAFAMLGEVVTGGGAWLGDAAIGRYAAKGKEHVVALIGYQGRILLHQLRYEHEVKPIAELPELVPLARRITAEEFDLACQLRDRMHVDTLDIAKYKDGVRARTLALIDGKIASGDAIAVEPTAAPATVTDLEAALRASVDKSPPVAQRDPKPEKPDERYPAYKPHDAAQFEQMTKVIGAAKSPQEAVAASMLFVLDQRYHREDITVVLGRLEKERSWDLYATAATDRRPHLMAPPAEKVPLAPKRTRAARARKAARKPPKRVAAKRARRR